jgi:putative peptidoglycan lipid II flippase
LASGYSVAYILGAAVSIGSLGRRLAGLRRWPLVLHIIRLAIPAGLAALLAYGLAALLDDLLAGLPAWLGNLLAVAAGGTVGLTAFVTLAYLVRISEVREAVALVRRRLGRPPSMDVRDSGVGDTEPRPRAGEP